MRNTDTSQRLQDEGFWQKMRGNIQEEWGDLTDQELEQARGSWDQLVGTLKEKTGETIEEIERRLEDWSS